jgi:hypothetical protein
MKPRTLSEEQIEQFLRRGHLVLRECFPRDVAREWAQRAFDRLGYDARDPSTWREARIHMPGTCTVEVKQFAPKVWAAICDLLGGEPRVREPCHWSDHFIVNLREGADRPWQPPAPSVKGWHKDGDFFRHFLDSPEQGLLTIVVWTDIEQRGGGTFIACDSVPVVARFLAAHPEGVLPGEFDFPSLTAQCRDFIEVTACAGDVYLLHPYVLHCVSQNHRGVPRIITNPPVALREPMHFNRDDPGEFSPVELAVLQGLGVERLDFRPAAPREQVVPERVLRQRRMLEEEQARLAARAAAR